MEGYCSSIPSQLTSARGYHARVSYEFDNSDRKGFQRRASSIDSHTEEEKGQIFSSGSRDEETSPTNDSKDMSRWHDDDLETYRVNLQLAALAESCASRRNVTAAKVALKLLHTMERPDSVAYNSVLKALAKISPSVLTSSGKTASDAAESLLRQMKDLHKRQVAANEAWYERLSEGTLSNEELEAGPPRVRVKPNVRSISTVMDALGRTGDLTAARRAEELLYALQQEYEATNDGALQPNLISYNTLLSAYANCGEARQCLQIIRDMPMDPDIISHNAVLHALARTQDDPGKAGQRAEAYLRQINKVRPNARSYSTCMDAWSQSGQPERAHRLLQEMMEAYHSSGRDPALRPNAITYSTVIHGYAVSKDSNKAMLAYQVWQDMQKEGVTPNQVTLNNVLNACATTRPPTPIVRRMVQSLYKHSLRHGQPDEVTFGIILKSCENWMDESTLSPIDVFTEACRRGAVSPGVLHHLRQAVSIETFRNLVGEHSNWDELPEKWRSSVRHRAPRIPRRSR